MTYRYDFRDGHAFDSTGVDLGKIAGMYRDTTTGEPSFLRTASGYYLPFEGSTTRGRDLHCAALRSHIDAAPPVADPARITPDEQAALLRHYGLEGPIVAAGASGLGEPRHKPATDKPAESPHVSEAAEVADNPVEAEQANEAPETELTEEVAGAAEDPVRDLHGRIVYSGNPGRPSEHGIPVAEGNPGIPSTHVLDEVEVATPGIPTHHPVVVGGANPGPALIA